MCVEAPKREKVRLHRGHNGKKSRPLRSLISQACARGVKVQAKKEVTTRRRSSPSRLRHSDYPRARSTRRPARGRTTAASRSPDSSDTPLLLSQRGRLWQAASSTGRRGPVEVSGVRTSLSAQIGQPEPPPGTPPWRRGSKGLSGSRRLRSGNKPWQQAPAAHPRNVRKPALGAMVAPTGS